MNKQKIISGYLNKLNYIIKDLGIDVTILLDLYEVCLRSKLKDGVMIPKLIFLDYDTRNFLEKGMHEIGHAYHLSTRRFKFKKEMKNTLYVHKRTLLQELQAHKYAIQIAYIYDIKMNYDYLKECLYTYINQTNRKDLKRFKIIIDKL